MNNYFKYIVVSEYPISRLVEAVNSKIQDGYEPIGGIMAVSSGSGWYGQAMIKKPKLKADNGVNDEQQ